MSIKQDKLSSRNIIIFYIGTLLLSVGGGLIMASGQGAGGLLFILSPLIMVLVVRILLGDGWKDAGLKWNLKQSWRWYLLALFLYFLVFPLIIGVSVLFGFTTLNMTVAEFLPIFLTGMAVQFVPRMIYSLSEEWGWRGYLEPRLEQLGFDDVQRHVAVGVLWGIWHFPLIMSSEYTTVPLIIFLPLFVLGTIMLAFVFGQMRKASGSVWPAVLLHGIANTMGYAILEGNFITYNNEIMGNIAPGGILIVIIFGFISFWIMRRRRATVAFRGEKTAVSQLPI